MWHRVRIAAVAVVVVGGLAACEPPPPPVVIEVNSLGAGRDVDPGDGVCETAPGNGECTVAAAIDEGNAAGRAVVRVLDATVGEPEAVTEPMMITGDLTLFTDDYQDSQNAWFSELRVEPGAILRLDRMHVISEHVLVEGTLLMHRASLWAPSTVAPAGRMLVLNSILFDFLGSTPHPLVENHGFFWMRFSTLAKDAPAVHTAPGATSRIGASSLTAYGEGSCTGKPVESEGYNESGPDCFSGPTDGGGASDSIPVGELGCGTDIVIDFRGNPRPGRGGCTFGHFEP